MSTQCVRVWFAVLTIGGASPRAKDFHSNAHLSCVPVAFGPKSTISQNRQLKTLVMLIIDFSKDIQSFLNSKVANIPSHESIGIDLGIKDLAICSDGNKYQNINKSQVVKKLEKKKRRLQRSISSRYEKNKEGGANNA